MEGFINASVKRQDEQLVITWEGEGLGNVAVYMSEDPDFTESEAAFVKVELDKDNGVFVYDVEFKKDGKEYGFEINAETGMIIDYDVDIDD